MKKLADISDIKDTSKMYGFTRVGRDVNGNPRYKISFHHLVHNKDMEDFLNGFINFSTLWEAAKCAARYAGFINCSKRTGYFFFTSFNVIEEYEAIRYFLYESKEEGPSVRYRNHILSYDFVNRKHDFLVNVANARYIKQPLSEVNL